MTINPTHRPMAVSLSLAFLILILFWIGGDEFTRRRCLEALLVILVFVPIYYFSNKPSSTS